MKKVYWKDVGRVSATSYGHTAPLEEAGNDTHKYWVGKIGGNIIADVWDEQLNQWRSINLPFDTIEEAKQWCEMVEATGAY